MSEKQPDYLSYLLRLWRVSDQSESQPHSKAVWRASLENPNTRQRQGFASLDELFDFLRQQIGEGAEPDRDLIRTDT